MPETARNLPTVTAIVPARNEEANIAAAVESLAAQVPPIEIIVVNDDSSDGTSEILAELQGRFPNLRVIDNHELPEGWTGKNHACYLGVKGAKQAKGEWLLFTDADVRHAPQAVTFGLGLAKQHQADLVSFSPEQELHTWWERVIIPYVFCQLAEVYPYRKVNNPKSSAAANGQWLLITRRVYETVGGHEAIRGEILDDVALARRVKEAGFRIYFVPVRGVVRTRMYRRWGEMWKGWTKNLNLLFRHRWAGFIRAGTEILIFFLLAWNVYGNGRMVSGFIFLFLLAHAAYARDLRRNGFSSWLALLLLPGSFLFVALVVSSWFAHQVRGKVVWKGRSYSTGTAK